MSMPRSVFVVGLGGLVAAPVHASAPLMRSIRGPNFDGDGYHDLAFGAQDGPTGAPVDTGEVLLLWGGEAGLELDPTRGAVLWQDGPYVDGEASELDGFGRAMAWGDFDGDCYDDLVVGVPGEDVGGLSYSGAIQIFYGGPDGLSGLDDAVLHRGSPGMDGGLASGAGFGRTLEVGDFNGDFYDDVAIGTLAEKRGEVWAGDVHIVYGGPDGLDAEAGPGDQVIDATTGGLGTYQAYAVFGSEMAAGDFDCDGRTDLALTHAGDIHVLHGAASGLHGRDAQLWSGSTRGLTGLVWQVGALVSGNFDGLHAADPNGWYISHGCMDLAIGLPHQAVDDDTDAGAVVVLYGQPYDAPSPGLVLDQAMPWYFDPSTGDIPPPESVYDRYFGGTLGVGQLDGHFATVHDDLLVGLTSGVVALLGTPDGLTDVDSVRWNRDTPGVPGVHGAPSDEFGRTIGYGDYDADGFGDVAIAAPSDDTAYFPGSGNDITVLDVDGGAPPVVTEVQSWISGFFPDQSLSGFEWLGNSITEGRSTWPNWNCE